MSVLNNIYYWWDYKNLSLCSEFLLLWFIYSFFKLLLVCIVNELVWPTQFFNRRQNINFQFVRYRVYTEVVLKLLHNRFKSFFFIKSLYRINF